ncbi:ankyrin, partial [Schizophyllum commune Tattone D]
GRTAAHLGTDNDHVDVVRRLLDKGAFVDPHDDAGYTPLHDAIGKGHLDVAKLLANRGADVDARTVDG